MIKEFKKDELIVPPPEAPSNLENKQETDLSIAPLKPMPPNANKPKSKYQLAREKEEQRRQDWEKNRQIREEREKQFRESTTYDFFARGRRSDKDSKSKKS